MSAPVVSRYDPATWRRQDLRHAARLWNLNLLRAIGLTPTQRNLAFIIGQDCFCRGYHFCIYNSLETMMRESEGVPPVLAISNGNLTEALCGFTTSEERQASPELAAGLKGLGIIRVEWTRFEGQRRWIVAPVADASLWKCGMVSVKRLSLRRHALDEAARSFAPHLPGLDFAPHPDLHDALVTVQTDERLIHA